jgi:hypothetical protein
MPSLIVPQVDVIHTHCGVEAEEEEAELLVTIYRADLLLGSLEVDASGLILKPGLCPLTQPGGCTHASASPSLTLCRARDASGSGRRADGGLGVLLGARSIRLPGVQAASTHPPARVRCSLRCPNSPEFPD